MPAPALVEPAYFTHPEYRETYADEVVDLAKMAGFVPDPEQELILGPWFGIDRRGLRVASEVAIVAPRQNIKTGVCKIAQLGEAFLFPDQLIIWSAHEFDTAEESFRDLCVLIESAPELEARVSSIKTGNGKQLIELANGSRIKFKARRKVSGRGLAGRRTVLDEALFLVPAHVGALMPLMSAQPDGQMIYGSSAGVATSEVLRGVRDRGRAGDPTLVYAEWCDETPCEMGDCDHIFDPRKGSGPEGCALDRVEGWKKANSQAGRRIAIETIASERRAMGRIPEEFARERLGWWDEPGEILHIFGATKWADCAIKRIKKPPTEGMVLAVSVSVDRSWSSVTMAVPLPGRVLVGVVEHEPGTGWVVEKVAKLQAKYGCPVVVDDHGPAADLIGEELSYAKKVPVDQAETLRAAGVDVTVAKTVDVLDAFASFYDRVQTQGVAHMTHPELEDAVAGAQPRNVGDRTAIGRRSSKTNVAPLEGVVLAAWGIGRKKKRRVPKSAVV